MLYMWLEISRCCILLNFGLAKMKVKWECLDYAKAASTRQAHIERYYLLVYFSCFRKMIELWIYKICGHFGCGNWHSLKIFGHSKTIFKDTFLLSFLMFWCP